MDMKSISQKLQDDIRKIMEGNVDEALVGKQRNIDVNKNGKIDGEDFVKLRAMKKTPDGKVHNCATHVEHAVLGKGVTISEQHAEPDAEGKIEWYTVQFENSTQKVLTKDLTITMSESHEHKNKKNKMEEAANRAQQAAIAISLIKAGKKDGKMPKPMKEDMVDEANKESKKDFQERQQRLAAAGAETAKDPARLKRLSSIPGYSAAMDLAKKSTSGVKEEVKKVVSPFDYKNYKSQIPKKPGELTGHDSKKTSTGTVYSKKPVKEEIENLDELSKTTLGSYAKKASRDAVITRKIGADFENKADKARSPGMKAAGNELSQKYKSKSLKRRNGLDKAVDRLTKEEFSFNDYLVASIHIVGEEHAVELANYAFNLQDTSIFENLETEAFNASNVNAQHAAGVKAHHDAELKKKADAGDENAKKRMELIKKSREAKTSEFNSRMDYM